MTDPVFTPAPGQPVTADAPEAPIAPTHVRTVDGDGGGYRPLPQQTPEFQRAALPDPAPEAQPVPMPSSRGLLTDPETGFDYRPLVVKRVTVRCASKIPAELMLDIVAAQQRLSDKKPEDMTMTEQLDSMHLMGEMLSGVVWDEDRDLIRTALRDKRDPVDINDLAQIVQQLWGEYNSGSGVGKER